MQLYTVQKTDSALRDRNLNLLREHYPENKQNLTNNGIFERVVFLMCWFNF